MLSGSHASRRTKMRSDERTCLPFFFLKHRGNRKYSHIVRNTEIFSIVESHGIQRAPIDHTQGDMKRVIWFYYEAWLSTSHAEFCVYCLQAVLRGLLKWTESCFSKTSTLILTLALKSMSLECVSHGKTITLRVQMGQDQKEEIYFWNTSSRSYGTYLKYFLNADISDILGVLTYLTLVGKKENKFHAATEQGMNWMAGICAPCFFFFFSCLLRIFVYLRFPGGNPRLGARSVHVSDRVRDAASLHVSQSACYALSSWSVLNRKGRLSPWEGIHRQLVREFRSLKKKKKKKIALVDLILWPHTILELFDFLCAGVLQYPLIVFKGFLVVFFKSALLQYSQLLCVVLVASLRPDERPPLAPAVCALEELDVQPGVRRRARFHFPNPAAWNWRQCNPGKLKSQDPELGLYAPKLWSNRADCGIYKSKCCRHHP